MNNFPFYRIIPGILGNLALLYGIALGMITLNHSKGWRDDIRRKYHFIWFGVITIYIILSLIQPAHGTIGENFGRQVILLVVVPLNMAAGYIIGMIIRGIVATMFKNFSSKIKGY